MPEISDTSHRCQWCFCFHAFVALAIIVLGTWLGVEFLPYDTATESFLSIYGSFFVSTAIAYFYFGFAGMHWVPYNC